MAGAIGGGLADLEHGAREKVEHERLLDPQARRRHLGQGHDLAQPEAAARLLPVPPLLAPGLRLLCEGLRQHVGRLLARPPPHAPARRRRHRRRCGLGQLLRRALGAQQRGTQGRRVGVLGIDVSARAAVVGADAPLLHIKCRVQAPLQAPQHVLRRRPRLGVREGEGGGDGRAARCRRGHHREAAGALLCERQTLDPLLRHRSQRVGESLRQDSGGLVIFARHRHV